MKSIVKSLCPICFFLAAYTAVKIEAYADIQARNFLAAYTAVKLAERCVLDQ